MDFGHSLHKIRDRHWLGQAWWCLSGRVASWVVGELGLSWCQNDWRKGVGWMFLPCPKSRRSSFWMVALWLRQLPLNAQHVLLAHGPIAGDTTPVLDTSALAENQTSKWCLLSERCVRTTLGIWLRHPKIKCTGALFEISPGGPVCGFSAYRVVFLAMNLTNDELRNYCEKAWHR